jgi:hypothetical protein
MGRSGGEYGCTHHDGVGGSDTVTITANNIHGNLKEIKRASQDRRETAKSKNQSTATLVPIEKITSTHKKQENNLGEKYKNADNRTRIGAMRWFGDRRGYR